MNDNLLALIGCAAALLVAGGLLGISQPIGRLLRRSGRVEPERRTVSFGGPVAVREKSETDRRAA